MSQVIDERIVEMRFDNQDFEKNVTTTMGTLDKLKSALKFDKDTKGIDNIADSVKKVTFDDLNKGIDTAKDKFSMLETVATGALMRIGNRLADSLVDTVKSLSIDQVTEGFSKYADKTTAIQTIMAATAQGVGTRWKDQGEQLEYINGQMDRLMWFSDETSYRFIDMVDNIGKFTAAGVDIQDAANSMMGISTWAAKSGAGIQGASRAMYNLSQAMGMGYLKIQDWKSIELANMATLEFKNTALETAADLGKLTRQFDSDGNLLGYILGDGLTDAQIKKIQKGEAVAEDYLITAERMRESLKEGWFDKDVMTAVFSQYGEYANYMNEWYEITGMTASETRTMIEKLGEGATEVDFITKAFGSMDEAVKETGYSVEELTELANTIMFDEFGKSAFYAAQEAKTFAEAIDATKDAVSTGWAHTFELIFGDYNEAKVLWTGLSERLYTIFMTGAEKRNEALKEWHNWGGYDILWEGVGNIWDAVGDVAGNIRDAFDEVFWGGPETLIKMSKAVHDFADYITLSDDALADIKTAAIGVADVFRGTWIMIRDALTIVWPFISMITGLFKTSGSWILKLIAQVGKALTTVFVTLSQWTTRLANGISSKSGFFKTLESGFKQVINVVGTVGSAIGNLGMKVINPVWKGIKYIGDELADGWKDLKTAIKPSIEPLQTALKYVKEWGKGAGERLYNKAGNYLDGTMKDLGKYMKDAFDKDLLQLINDIANAINNLCLKIEHYAGLLKDIGLRNTLEEIYHDVGQNMKMKYPGISEFLSDTVHQMVAFKNSAKGVFKDIKGIFSGKDKKDSAGVAKGVSGVGKAIEEETSKVDTYFGKFVNKLKEFKQKAVTEGAINPDDYREYGRKFANVIENSFAPIEGMVNGFVDSNLFARITAGLESMGLALRRIGKNILDFGVSLKDGLILKLKDAYSNLHETLANLPKFGKAIGSSIKNQILTVGKFFKEIGKGLGLKDGITKLGDKILEFVSSIPGKIGRLGETLGKGLGGAIDSALKFVSGLLNGFWNSAGIQDFKRGWDELWNYMKTGSTTKGEEMGHIIANSFKNIGAAINTAWNDLFEENFSVTSLVDMLNSILTTGLIVAITRFVNNLSGLVKSISAPLKSLGKQLGDAISQFAIGVRDGLRGTESFGTKIAPFIGIVAVIAALAYSFYQLSKLNPDQIERGKEAILTIVGSISAIFALAGGISIGSFKMGGLTGKFGLAAQMVGLCAVLLSISHMMTQFAKMPVEKLGQSIIAMEIIIWSIAGLIKVMSSSATSMKGANPIKLSGLAGVILALGKAVKTIIKAVTIMMDAIGSGEDARWGAAGASFAAVGLLLAGLIYGMKIILNNLDGLNTMNGRKGWYKSSVVNLLAISIVIHSIGNAISKIILAMTALTAAGGADAGSIIAMTLAFAGIIGAIMLLVTNINKMNIGKGSGASSALKTSTVELLAISVLIFTLGEAISKISLGLAAVAAVGADWGQILAFFGGLALVLAALGGIVALAGTFAAAAPTLLSVAAVLASFTLMLVALGPAMIGIAAGLTALITALIGIGDLVKLNLSGFVVGMLAMVGMFAILGAMAPLIAAAGKALLPFSISIGILAVSLAILAAAIALLATQCMTAQWAGDALDKFLTGLIQGLVHGLEVLIIGIGNMAVELGEALYKLLAEATPRAIEGLLEGLAKVGDSCVQYIGPIVEMICIILRDALVAMEPYAYEIGRSCGSVIAKLCEGLAAGVGDSFDIIAEVAAVLLGSWGIFSLFGTFGSFTTILKGIGIAAELAAGIGAIVGVFKLIGMGLQALDEVLGDKFANGLTYMVDQVKDVIWNIVEMLLVFGALFELGGVLGSTAPMILAGIGITCEIIAGIGTVIAACKAVGGILQGLDDFFGSSFENGMTYIFETIGKAVGALVGGFGGQAIQSMSNAITNIESFKGLVETINEIDIDSVNGLYKLSEAMDALTEVNWSWFNKTVTDMHTGSSGNNHSGSDLKTNLETISDIAKAIRDAIAELGDGVSESDAEKLDTIAKTIKTICDSLGSGLETDSLKSLIVGKVDFEKLKGLKDFGMISKVFKEAADNIEDDPDSIAKDCKKISSVVDGLEPLIKLTERFKQGVGTYLSEGTNPLTQFTNDWGQKYNIDAKNLKTGETLFTYKGASLFAVMMADLANIMPILANGFGSLNEIVTQYGFFDINNDAAESYKNFFRSVTYAKKMIESLESMVDLAESLSSEDIQKVLKNSTSYWTGADIEGTNSLVYFLTAVTDFIKSIAPAFATFNTDISGIEDFEGTLTKFDSVVKAVKSIKGIGTMLKDDDFADVFKPSEKGVFTKTAVNAPIVDFAKNLKDALPKLVDVFVDLAGKDYNWKDITTTAKNISSVLHGLTAISNITDLLKDDKVKSLFTLTDSDVPDSSPMNIFSKIIGEVLPSLVSSVDGLFSGEGFSFETFNTKLETLPKLFEAFKKFKGITDMLKDKNVRELFENTEESHLFGDSYEVLETSPVFIAIHRIGEMIKLMSSSVNEFGGEGFNAETFDSKLSSIKIMFETVKKFSSVTDLIKDDKIKALFTYGGKNQKENFEATTLGQFVEGVTKVMKKIGESMTDMGDVTAITTQFNSMVECINGITAPINDLSSAKDGIKNIQSLSEELPKLATALKEASGKLVGEDGNLNQISNLGTALSTSLTSISNTLKDFKITIPSDIFKVDKELGNNITTQINAAIQDAIGKVNNGGDSKSGTLGFQIDSIGVGPSAASSFSTALQSALKDTAITIEKLTVSDSAISTIVSNIQSSLSNATININPNFQAANADVKVGADISADTSQAESAGTSLAEALASAFKSSHAILGAVHEVLDNCCNTMRRYYMSFYSVGNYLMQGLDAGLRSMETTITATCNRIITKAAEAANKAGEIQSPSRVFMRIGRFLGMGLEKGLKNSENTVSKESENLANTATDAAKDALEIHSPSRVWEAIGKSCGDGFAKGLAESASNTVLAVKSFTDMMTELIAAETNANEQSKYQNAQDLYSHYESLGLLDSRFNYDYWSRLNNMTDEQLKDLLKEPEGENEDIEKTLLDTRREIETNLKDAADGVKDYYKNLFDNGLSSADQVLTILYEAVDAFSEEEKAALTEPYVAAMTALWEFRDAHNEAVMEFKKSNGLITTSDELEYYLELIKRYDPGSDKYLETLSTINELKDQIKSERWDLADILGLNTFSEQADNLIDKISIMQKGSTEWINTLKDGLNLANDDGENWINEQKDYGRIGLAGELEAYYRLREERVNYLTKLGQEAGMTNEQIAALIKNDEKIKSYDKNIHNATNDISDALVEKNKKLKEAKKTYNEFNKSSIQTSMKNIWTEDEKLIEKMSENTKTLRDSLQDRRKEFREYFGLFDEVKDEFNEVSISEMIFNQNDQAEYLKYFTDLMDTAKSKLTNKDLIKSLQEMGVDAMPYLRAIAGADSEGIMEFERAWKNRDEAAKKAAEAAESAELDELIKKEKRKGEEAGKAYWKAYYDAENEFNEKVNGEDPDGKKAAMAGARTLDWMQDNGYTNMGAQTSAMQEMYFEGTKNGVSAMQNIAQKIDEWMESGILQNEWIYGLSTIFRTMTANGTFGDLTEEDFTHIKDTVMALSSYGITAGAANLQTVEDLDKLYEDMFTRTIDGPLEITMFGSADASVVARDISFTKAASQQLVTLAGKNNELFASILENINTGKIKLIMDTGAIVGEMQAEIDTSLGSNATDSRSDFSA